MSFFIAIQEISLYEPECGRWLMDDDMTYLLCG
jgi:hypothetical protein